MPGHEQELENDDGEAEIVVVRRPQDLLVAGEALEFRRLMRRHADIAVPALSAGGHLEAVAVDELHGRVGGHHQIAVVDVADDMAAVVDHREGACGVGGGMDEEAPSPAVGNSWRRSFGL